MAKALKILHVIPSFAPAWRYGGAMRSVYELCRGLGELGCDVRVLTTDSDGPREALDVAKEREVEMAEGVRVRYCRRIMSLSVSSDLSRRLPSYVRWADVVHLTAVYSFPTIPTLLTCKILGKPVIWSPRGALQRWEGSTHVVLKSVWETICRTVAPRQLSLHVTSEEEAVESVGRVPEVEVVVVPNGVDIPEGVTPHDSEDGVLRLLYLGRLHPIKGIENLLAACTIMNDNFEIAWSLIIAGVGDPRYTELLRKQIETQGLSQQVEMVGQVAQVDQRRLFENSSVAVVPSYKESFGMVVAEALAHSVPVVASKATPWKRITEVECGLWVENDPSSLASAIGQMGNMPIREMGQRGRLWMRREFSWPVRAKEMEEAYRRTTSSHDVYAL